MVSALALAVSDSVAKERYKAMRGKKKMYQGKKKMYQKKYRELKKNCVPVTTSSPTITVTTISPTVVPVTTPSPTITVVADSGCYMGGKCKGSSDCCDCEMTKYDSMLTWWKPSGCGSMCAPVPVDN